MGKFKDPKTTVRLYRDTHKRLEKLGTKNESFDTIIKKLLDKYEEDIER